MNAAGQTHVLQMYKFYPKSKARIPLRAIQGFRIMRMIIVFTFFFIIQASASIKAQNISLSENNAPLKKVLFHIGKQAGLDFLASSSVLNVAKPVTISVNKQPIVNVLEAVFKDQPLQYEIQGKIVIVSKKTIIKKDISSQALRLIIGLVTDTDGHPLAGATIKIKSSGLAVSTNYDGTFSINLTGESDILLVSFVGFKPTEIPINNSTEQPLHIKLLIDESPLNTVQVIGYGTTTKRLSTGSISSINAVEIAKQPVTNVLSALSGRIPGMFIQTTNGLPGGNINIQIRGKGSIQAGTDPLYVIDGVPFSSTVVPTFNATAAGSITGVISPLNSLNPADIESISVLKDADATAIYGSRGSNGVVLITTKKGKAGQTKANVTISQGLTTLANYPRLLNLQQYLQLRHEGFKNDGTKPTVVNAPDLLVYDTTKTTNWPKYYLGNTGHVTDAQVGLSGGADNTSFNISGNYHGESTVLAGDNFYRRGGLHATVQHTSPNKKFSLLFSGSFTSDNNRSNNPVGDLSFGLILPPDFALFEASGNYNWIMSNPAAEMQSTNLIKTNNLIGNLVLSYNLFKSLDFKVSLGYNKIDADQTTQFPTVSLYPGSTNYADFDQNSNQSYILEPQLSYKKIFDKSTITVLAGATYQNKNAHEETIEASNFNTRSLMQNIGSAQSLVGNNSNSQYKYVSVFGRITYNWQDIYILNATIRRDGSSRFGFDNQYGNFGSIGGAWLFSNLQWVKDKIPFLSYGKLRASYGITGNDQIQDYQYLSTYASNGYLNYQGFSALYPTRIANFNFHWETTRKLEFAAEFGFLRDRILFNVNRYDNRSDDQLVAYAIPYLTGFNSYQANLPAVVENSGWEFEATTQNIVNTKFRWSTTLNLTLPKNQLNSFQGFEESSYSQTLQIGYDITRYYGYTFLGVDPSTGKASYASQSGAPSTTPYLYNTLGKQTPDFYGGLGNTFSFKNWQLDIFGQFAKQMAKGGIYNSPGTKYNNYAFVMNRWTKPGDQTNVPKASNKNDSFYASSSANFFNTSYFRLKNVSLSYSFSPITSKKLGLAQLRVFAEGQNLMTIWNRDAAILDPESGALTNIAKNIPPIRSIVVGLQVNL